MSKSGLGLFAADDLREFASAIFSRVNVPDSDSQILADTLVEADLRGVSSHGCLRIPAYVNRLRNGGMAPMSNTEVVTERAGAILIDGHYGIGQVISVRAMGLAIERAQTCGVAFVGVRNSGHFGMAAYYSLMAVEAGMVGFVFSNASPGLAPWGSQRAMLGNNPWSIAVPAGKAAPIVLDMANSVAARGKIRMAAVTGQSIPEGWAADKYGRPTTDPGAALEGFILPVGGHKGSAISVLIDLLTGGLTGSAVLDDVGSIAESGRPQRTSHLFGAVNVSAFQDLEDYCRRVDDYVRRVHEAPRAEGIDRIYVPGELESLTREQRRRFGVPFEDRVIDQLRSVAADLEVSFPAWTTS